MTGKPNSSSLPDALPCGRALPKNPVSGRDARKLLKGMSDRLDAFVLEHKLNRSDARSKILTVIAEEAHHFRAQDLVDKLQVRFPEEVGRSTVYRNLPILVDCGLIQEGPPAPDGEVLYELSQDHHHDHIVCLDCRTIFEFHDDQIEDRQLSVTKNLGFTVKDHRHVVYASCDQLKKRS